MGRTLSLFTEKGAFNTRPRGVGREWVERVEVWVGCGVGVGGFDVAAPGGKRDIKGRSKIRGTCQDHVRNEEVKPLPYTRWANEEA